MCVRIDLRLCAAGELRLGSIEEGQQGRTAAPCADLIADAKRLAVLRLRKVRAAQRHVDGWRQNGQCCADRRLSHHRPRRANSE